MTDTGVMSHADSGTGTSVGFAQVQRVLALFTEAIAGRPLHLKPLDERSANSYISRIATDGLSIHVPQAIADFELPRHNFGAFRVIVLHQIGYLENGTFEFDLSVAATRMTIPEALRRTNSKSAASQASISTKYQLALPPSRPVSALERFFAAWRRPDLMRMVFVTLEDLRIDTLLRRRYPGAAADLARVLAHALAARPVLSELRPLAALIETLVQYSLGADRTTLLAGDRSGLRREIIDNAEQVTQDRASVYDSARVAIDIYSSLEAFIKRQRRRQVNPEEGDESTGDEQTLDQQLSDDSEPSSDPDAPSGGGDVDDDSLDAQAADEDFDGFGVEFRGQLMPDLVHRQLAGGQVGTSQSPDAPNSETSETPLKAPRDAAESLLRASQTKFAASKTGWSDGLRSFLYDEWNYLSASYESAWCRLYEQRLRGDNYQYISEVRRRHAVLANQVKRQFSFIKPESWQRVHRTSDGDELGLDSLIEAVIDRRTGHASDEYLYVRRDRALREVAAAFLVDMSASTDFPVPEPDTEAAGQSGAPTPATTTATATGSNAATPVPKQPFEQGPYLYGGYDDRLPLTPAAPKRRVIDVAKESLALMCDALQTLGDSYAVYGFSGEGRDNVEFHVAKDFGDRLSARTWGALAAMQPRRSTRMGPAIRHAATKLISQPMRQKVLIIISDGYPQDSDYGPNRSDDEYGIQDTARALQEAERVGISTFCITIDPAGHDYLRRMCSAHRYLVIDDVRSLPDELTKVYRALTSQI